ncbi:MAG TPA: nucleotidyltransferase domain-containing protein [Candidatus Rifleibacterium sp.]|nr:nucleotidyltransferase domain-containing protein [Candidatus Rifleibacterium sp.]HPT46419.1 nucleotidyltransferase domain-containing protein [Candidatus Rifleibacterium sp.]
MMNKNEILKELKALKHGLKEQFHIEKLGIFGSYASNSAHPESDLDLLVEFEDELSNIYEIKKELKALLEQKFGMKIDLAREKYLKPFYREEILKQVIYV